MISVNIRALTDLSLRFSDHLIRHRGGLLNVGSIAGFMPGREWRSITHPSLCAVVYGSDACGTGAAWRARDGVCPVPCRRNFRRAPGSSLDFDSVVLNVLPAAVASQAYRGLMANQACSDAGIGIKIGAVPAQVLPARVVSSEPSAGSSCASANKISIFRSETVRTGAV